MGAGLGRLVNGHRRPAFKTIEYLGDSTHITLKGFADQNVCQFAKLCGAVGGLFGENNAQHIRERPPRWRTTATMLVSGLERHVINLTDH
jgi:hypothetical protein